MKEVNGHFTKVAFELLVMKLAAQRSDVASLRNQAGIAAAVNGLIASVFSTFLDAAGKAKNFFGDAVLGMSLVGTILFLIFSASLAFSVLVVVRWRDFTFSFNSMRILEVRMQKGCDAKTFESLISDGEYFFELLTYSRIFDAHAPDPPPWAGAFRTHPRAGRVGVSFIGRD